MVWFEEQLHELLGSVLKVNVSVLFIKGSDLSVYPTDASLVACFVFFIFGYWLLLDCLPFGWLFLVGFLNCCLLQLQICGLVVGFALGKRVLKNRPVRLNSITELV